MVVPFADIKCDYALVPEGWLSSWKASVHFEQGYHGIGSGISVHGSHPFKVFAEPWPPPGYANNETMPAPDYAIHGRRSVFHISCGLPRIGYLKKPKSENRGWTRGCGRWARTARRWHMTQQRCVRLHPPWTLAATEHTCGMEKSLHVWIHVRVIASPPSTISLIKMAMTLTVRRPHHPRASESPHDNFQCGKLRVAATTTTTNSTIHLHALIPPSRSFETSKAAFHPKDLVTTASPFAAANTTHRRANAPTNMHGGFGAATSLSTTNSSTISTPRLARANVSI
ncbi:hypothetical protein BD410DRAFT_798591 [Rickenella mellea]|uniref:Uncharacterized protein n=1 Tax=Rickenella mellea TaxID=50990 RepID=A0A4R5XG83_9AGAM|nr:hypothetical protein BD410DRAFT_798591 [Rickenella mellea]